MTWREGREGMDGKGGRTLLGQKLERYLLGRSTLGEGAEAGGKGQTADKPMKDGQNTLGVQGCFCLEVPEAGCT